jgi:hypothetical protein
VDGEDRPAALSLSQAEVRAALAEGRDIKVGTAFKGAHLDLTGLESLNLQRHLLPEVVNGLIRAVRDRRVASVIIDFTEGWSSTKTILGNMQDPVYIRVKTQSCGDGRYVLQLRQRRRRAARQPKLPASPLADVVVVRSRCLDLAVNRYEVAMRVDGRVERLQIVVAAENPGTGAIQAATAALADHRQATVALPMKGPFLALEKVLCDEGGGSGANTDFGDAVGCLRSAWTWKVEEERGLCGRPLR